MESRPLRARVGLNAMRDGPADEEAGVRAGRDQTPLPPAEDWSSLGATRVVQGAIEAGNTEVKADTALPAPAPGVLAENAALGDYRLLKRLGEGAMGEVWKAHQISFNREVALKILFPHIAGIPKLVERLGREAKVMFELDHPNIIQGYGWDFVAGRPYVAMEYVDGESLQKWLGRTGTLSVGDAVQIALTCARALDYAHGRGLVHRDIKPDNVLITRKGQIKVADLGMVKKLDDEEMALTQTGHAVGTPWYMPLEQARNAKETDRRCDIYALGCMLYCLITGQPPFTGRTLVEVIEAKEKGTFPPARKSNADVPERLDLILLKMTAKLPGHRYQTCAEAIKDLESLKLASGKLSFLSGAPAVRPPVKPAQSTMAGSISPPGSDDKKTTEIWYLRYRNHEGQVQVRKLTRDQVMMLAAAPNFDPTAKISRDPKEGFRALGTYREFEHIVLGRLSKTAADETTVRYRNLYKKIEEQDRKRERTTQKTGSNFSYWSGIFFRVGGICAGVGLLAFLLWYFANGLGK
jgi:eukaryotic-like serine/threonine-protein kinase